MNRNLFQNRLPVSAPAAQLKIASSFNCGLNPNSEAGLSVAATPRRSKVQATPSSPVAAAIMPLPEKMRRGRRYHPVATRRRRYFRPAASKFWLNRQNEILAPEGRQEVPNLTFLPSLPDSNNFSTRHPALKRRAIFNRRLAAEILLSLEFKN
jgi:hypothetical protein